MPRGSMVNTIVAIKAREKEKQLKQYEKMVREAEAAKQREQELYEMCPFGRKQFKKYREMFNLYDTDKSGSISVTEVRKVMRNAGMEVNNQSVSDIFAEMDIDSKVSLGLKLYPADQGRNPNPEQRRSMVRWPEVQEMSNLQLKTCRDAFLMFDKDGDGAITTEEVKAILSSMGHDNHSNVVQAIILPFDADGNGTIEFNEFLTVMSKVLEDENTDEDMVAVFRILDQDGDGFITKSDLRECCIRVGSQLTSPDMDEMLTEADKDGDGQISFEEFLKILEARS